MPDRFRGRNAIVTGASRGIGAAIAQRLAAEGASLVIVARTLDRHDHLAGSLNETAQRCREYGARVETIVADLADADSRAAIAPRALELFDGRVDILVNNGAAAVYQSTLDYPLRRRRMMFEVNVEAPIDLAQGVVPTMTAQGEGWIVNVSSATARFAPGPPYRSGGVNTVIGVYGATKAALNRITHAFAVELYGTGVRVNTIEPRAAVMSEGAEALVGDIVGPEAVEPMETMVEATLALCDCPPERTGGVHVSLALLAELGVTARALDGSEVAP
jgi:NAD(P)-dependent dehydrogenase (short-subunit alcohol dehydrogenase family)